MPTRPFLSRFRPAALLAPLLVWAIGVSAVSAESGRTLHYSADVRVSLNGVRLASGNFQTTVSPDTYRIAGALESRGLAELFERFDGRSQAVGAITDSGVKPDNYVISYVSGDKAKRTEIHYTSGRISDTTNVPPLRKRGDWIPLDEAQLEGARDPFSAMFVTAPRLEAVCDQTLQSFDGAMRADIALSFARTVQFETQGYAGPAVICQARFKPMSGYHGARDSIAYMRDRARITITFVPVGDSSLYAPVGAQIGTPVGTLSVVTKKLAIIVR